jgi:hypothetical protein
MLTEAELQRVQELREKIGNKMKETPDYNHEDRAIAALNALATHLIGNFGWREMEWDDDGERVTLFTGSDYIDLSLTSAERIDSISERNHGAMEEREFNVND